MKFTVYSKRLCSYCSKIEQILNRVSIEKGYCVIIYELDVDFNKEQFYAEFGEGSTFPQVVCGETHLGGCFDTVKYLQKNNIL
jgi:glutaredoxin